MKLFEFEFECECGYGETVTNTETETETLFKAPHRLSKLGKSQDVSQMTRITLESIHSIRSPPKFIVDRDEPCCRFEAMAMVAMVVSQGPADGSCPSSYKVQLCTPISINQLSFFKHPTLFIARCLNNTISTGIIPPFQPLSSSSFSSALRPPTTAINLPSHDAGTLFPL